MQFEQIHHDTNNQGFSKIKIIYKIKINLKRGKIKIQIKIIYKIKIKIILKIGGKIKIKIIYKIKIKIILKIWGKIKIKIIYKIKIKIIYKIKIKIIYKIKIGLCKIPPEKYNKVVICWCFWTDIGEFYQFTQIRDPKKLFCNDNKRSMICENQGKSKSKSFWKLRAKSKSKSFIKSKSKSFWNFEAKSKSRSKSKSKKWFWFWFWNILDFYECFGRSITKNCIQENKLNWIES